MADKSVITRPTPNFALKFLCVFFKIFISGSIAFIILTAFCFLYYNLPQHLIEPDNVTDYRQDVYAFFSKFTEGFGYGMTNNEGYINGFDYEKGMNISTLLMDSSYMEGTYIIFENLTVNILGKLLNKAVYNLGISGHRFPKCAYHFRAALQKYKPSDYAIIETSDVRFSEKALEEVINGSMSKIPAYDKGVLSLLRRNNFLRLMYEQFFQIIFVL